MIAEPRGGAAGPGGCDAAEVVGERVRFWAVLAEDQRPRADRVGRDAGPLPVALRRDGTGGVRRRAARQRLRTHPGGNGVLGTAGAAAGRRRPAARRRRGAGVRHPGRPGAAASAAPGPAAWDSTSHAAPPSRRAGHSRPAARARVARSSCWNWVPPRAHSAPNATRARAGAGQIRVFGLRNVRQRIGESRNTRSGTCRPSPSASPKPGTGAKLGAKRASGAQSVDPSRPDPASINTSRR